jgi:hypothetical protein
MDAEGFTIVSRGGVLGKNKGNKTTSQSLSESSQTPQQIVLSVNRLLCGLESSVWARECVKIIEESRGEREEGSRVLCRGVGCVGRSQVARMQCAFALILQNTFGRKGTRPEFVEPMLNDEERVALLDLGFQLESVSGAESGDLIYAPHAPAGLYHNELLLRWQKPLLKAKDLFVLFVSWFFFS